MPSLCRPPSGPEDPRPTLRDTRVPRGRGGGVGQGHGPGAPPIPRRPRAMPRALGGARWLSAWGPRGDRGGGDGHPRGLWLNTLLRLGPDLPLASGGGDRCSVGMGPVLTATQ